VENKYALHKFILCAICVPKIIKVGGNLTKLWQEQFCSFFETRCIY